MQVLERYPGLMLAIQLAEHTFPSRYDNLIHPDCSKDEQIQHWKKKLDLDQLEVIYVYGMAEGRPFLALQEWLEAASGRHLVFLEKHLSSIHKLLFCSWGEKLLLHPQVHLKLGSSDQILEQCAREFPTSQIGVTTMNSEGPAFQRIKTALLRKTILWNSVISEELSSHLLHRNIFSNFQKLPCSFYVNATKGAFAGQPALICGAGPSLEKAGDELKAIRDKVLLIGCGSALSALSHLQVRPHLGIAIDPNAGEKKCLQGCSWRDLPLIYGNRLYREVFTLFDGPYGYLRSPTGSRLEKEIEEKLGLTDQEIGGDLGREALSVTTMALALACFWGCSPIILAGVDLAYLGTREYAQGGVERDRVQEHLHRILYRRGAQGKKVPTTMKWIMEKETIDAYTKLYPHLTFMNATGAGLGFSNISPCSWEEIRAALVNSEPVDERLSHLISSHPTPVSSQKLRSVLGEVRAGFERCLDYAKKLEQEIEGSGKWVLYEEELSQERVYQLTLGPALDALEVVYRLNIDIPFSRQKWRFLVETIEEFL